MNNSLAAKRLIAAAKRQWWVVLQAMVIVGAVAGYLANKEPLRPFHTQASFLVNVVVADSSSTATAPDSERYYLAQSRVLRGEKVATAVRTRLPAPAPTIAEISGMVDVTLDAAEGTAVVYVTGPDPSLIVDIANAWAPAYEEVATAGRGSALQKRSDDLTASINDTKQQIDDLTKQEIDAIYNQRPTETIKQEQLFFQEQFSTLFSEQQAVLTQIATQPQVVEVLDSATGASRAARPSVPVRTGLGVAVGMVLGIALAAVRELLDDKLRDSAAAAETAGVQVIADIPKSSRRLDGTLPVVVEPNKGLAEAIRSLRTTVRFLGVTEPIHSVAITSPAPGDGKSLVAANLAAACALAGSRTILVSGDLRRPSIDPLFAASSEIGLSDLLLALEQSHRELGNDRLGLTVVNAEDYLIETPVANLWFLPSGTPCPNPAELLGSPRLPGVIKELCSVADMVVIDCPPTIVAEAVVLAKVVDGAILVTSVNRSRKSALRTAVGRLSTSRANLLGIVINRSTSERKSTYGDYSSYYSPERAAEVKAAVEGSTGAWVDSSSKRGRGRKQHAAT